MFVPCGGPKKSPHVHSFNTLIIPIIRDCIYNQFSHVSLSHFGVRGRMWNSIISVADHCLLIYLEQYGFTIE